MFTELLQLIVLFFVIIDPFVSFTVFYALTENMSTSERKKIATYAIIVAAGLSFVFLMFGKLVLSLFSTNIDEFKVAGGIILGILGIQMVLGIQLSSNGKKEENAGRAIATIIATPLLTGPAAMTAIIINASEYGRIMTGIAIACVLGFTALIFYQAKLVNRLIGKTLIQIMSTILGLVTLAWGVKFVVEGLVVILNTA